MNYGTGLACWPLSQPGARTRRSLPQNLDGRAQAQFLLTSFAEAISFADSESLEAVVPAALLLILLLIDRCSVLATYAHSATNLAR
jgi:hypothetical protein